jgi:gas vesicle structural protein
MTVMNDPPTGGGGGSAAGALYDVIELILDRGLVIDVFVRVSVVGIELLTIDARVVVSSIDTYLRFAEACNRLDPTGGRRPVGLPGLVGEITEDSAKRKVKGAIAGAGQAIADSIHGIVAPSARDSG